MTGIDEEAIAPSFEADLDLLRAVAAGKTIEAQAEAVFRAPRLLTPGVAESLLVSLEDVNEEERPGLASAVQTLRELRNAIEAGVAEYPLGLGPIEDLWERQLRGEVTQGGAAELAASEVVVASLAPVYAAALSRLALTSSEQGEWRSALELQRLLLAGADAMAPSQLADEVGRLVRLDWVEVARWALLRVPDGRILRSAISAGERVAHEGLRMRNRALSSTTLYRLGVLCLDPYTVGEGAFSGGLAEHRLRLLADTDVKLLPEDEWRMPTAAEGLRMAESYFRNAAELSEGHVRGLVREGLASTLYALDTAGEVIDRDELQQVAVLALEELDPEADLENRLAVEAILRDVGVETAPSGEGLRTVDLPPLELERRFGLRVAVNIIRHGINELAARDPARTHKLVEESRDLFRRSPFDVRVFEAVTEVKLLVAVHARVLEGSFEDVAAERSSIHAVAREEQWPARVLSATLVELATRSEARGRPDEGVALLDEAIRVDPDLAARHRTGLGLLRALLLSASVMTFVTAGEGVKGIQASIGAIAAYVELDEHERAVSELDQARKVAYGDPDLVAELVVGLKPLVLELEVSLGAAVDVLQRIWRDAVTSLAGENVDASVLLELLQLAKGARFGALVQSPMVYRAADDDVAVSLLRQIAEAESALGASGSPSAPETLLLEDFLLTAYVTPRDLSGGATVAERVANLQHQFDAHVDRCLVGEPTPHALGLMGLDEIRGALDARTVLFEWFLGADTDGRMTNSLFLVTREDLWAGGMRHEGPGYGAWVRAGDRDLPSSSFAALVWSHRGWIQEEPFGRPVSTEGGRWLTRSRDTLLGAALETLGRWRASGKDHLCIVPHGPFHFYPLHLLGAEGKQLCDEWIVTYLPNVRLLAAAHRELGRRERDLSVIGLGFEDVDGVEPLERAVSEVRAIGSLFGTEPILDGDARKDVVIDALSSSRYVHLATHGQHNVNAPAFQSLFVAADGDAHSRLYAYEVLSLDLRGLELLTLSACETALGRFDSADNIRGLPAAFLLAGARTLVGTLWPAEDSASETFFSELYARLNDDLGLLEAYAAAQRTTRNGHPEYRDWGAFYLMGGW